MEEIKVFSTDCPRCKILIERLQKEGINFLLEKENFDELFENNIQTAPILKYKGKYYQFGEAINLLQKGELLSEN